MLNQLLFSAASLLSAMIGENKPETTKTFFYCSTEDKQLASAQDSEKDLLIFAQLDHPAARNLPNLINNTNDENLDLIS